MKKKILIAGLLATILTTAGIKADIPSKPFGPYLVPTDKGTIVRVNIPSPSDPQIEIKTTAGKITVKNLKKYKNKIWEAPINNKNAAVYRISNGGTYSPWYALYQSPKNKIFKFLVYGDTRDNPEILSKISSKMAEEKAALVLHVGDIVNKPSKKEWLSFFTASAALLPSTPIAVTRGNHEKDGEDMAALFLTNTKKKYYAFKKGPAHFLAIDTCDDFSIGSRQYVFIYNTLKKWKGSSPIIVFMHHPPFSTGGHGSRTSIRKHLLPLFEDAAVDLVFSGHDHIYERMDPINGVRYIVTGGGAGPLSKAVDSPDVSALAEKHHYVSVTINGKRIEVTAKTVDGKVIDKFSFDHTAPPYPKSIRRKYPTLPRAGGHILGIPIGSN